MQELTDMLVARGAVLVGFADLSPLEASARMGFPRAVSFALALDARIVAAIRTAPTQEYGLEYDRLNDRLTQMSRDAAEMLISRGHNAHARPATHDWDKATFRAPIQHKTAATLAGLGWIGKCALLVTPQYGSALRWCTVLTDAPLPVGQAITESRCGECRECVAHCPGQACKGTLWKQGMEREMLFDPVACRKGMEIAGGAAMLICGRCVAVCPYTRAYLKRAGAEK